MGSALFSYSYWCQVTSALYKPDTSLCSLRRTVWALHEDVRLRVPCQQWFLQAGRCATKVEKPMRATVCFSIEHGNSRDAYVKTSNASLHLVPQETLGTLRSNDATATRTLKENRFNKQNNNFVVATVLV